jgi:hypothetical protein
MICPSTDIENKAVDRATSGLGKLLACSVGVAAPGKQQCIPCELILRNPARRVCASANKSQHFVNNAGYREGSEPAEYEVSDRQHSRHRL